MVAASAHCGTCAVAWTSKCAGAPDSFLQGFGCGWVARWARGLPVGSALLKSGVELATVTGQCKEGGNLKNHCHPGRNHYKLIPETINFVLFYILWHFLAECRVFCNSYKWVASEIIVVKIFVLILAVMVLGTSSSLHEWTPRAIRVEKRTRRMEREWGRASWMDSTHVRAPVRACVRVCVGACMYVCMYIYIYACCRVINWSNFCVFVLAGPMFCFCFWKSRSPCRKKRIVQPKKDQKVVLETGPILLHNIIGPIFNTTLDQFLTQHFCCFLLEAHIYSVFSKTCKI